MNIFSQVMGELVNSLSYLCKLIDILVGQSTFLKPDFFRLSKLNKLGSEQMRQLWDVLHLLCCFSVSSSRCSDDPYKCVESFLRKQGSLAAYFVPPSATARQLLICFGYLLSEEIIEGNIDKILVGTPLVEELPSFMIKSKLCGSIEETLSGCDEEDPQTLLNYASFVSGKVKHNLRAIANFNQEKVGLFSKIHQAVAASHTSSHLSTGDLLMTVRPELQSQFVAECHHCVPLLQAYSKWHRKRHFFWEWMVSVVEEEFKIQPKPYSVAEITHLHEFLRKLRSDVEKPEVMKGEILPDESYTSASTRRLCLSKNSEVLDSMIENVNLKINTMKLDNENKIEKIKTLLTTDDQFDELNSILQEFSSMERLREDGIRMSDLEQTLVDKRKI